MVVVTFSKVEKFHGKDVRTYEADDGHGNVERCMTIPDLARMVGYHARDIRYIVERNLDEFTKKGFLKTVTVLKDFPNAPRGRKPQFVLTLGGVTNTLLYLESSRINDPEKRAKVQEFRDWAVQVLVSFQRGKHLKRGRRRKGNVARCVTIPDLARMGGVYRGRRLVSCEYQKRGFYKKRGN